MPGFLDLLRGNRNYRLAWTGQVVSEIGDHFNNIAVFSLALAHTQSGLAVTGVMIFRAGPAGAAGPAARGGVDPAGPPQKVVIGQTPPRPGCASRDLYRGAGPS